MHLDLLGKYINFSVIQNLSFFRVRQVPTTILFDDNFAKGLPTSKVLQPTGTPEMNLENDIALQIRTWLTKRNIKIKPMKRVGQFLLVLNLNYFLAFRFQEFR